MRNKGVSINAICAICPYRLLDLVDTPASPIRKSHVVFYMKLYRYADFRYGITVEQTRKEWCAALGMTENLFDILLKDLVIERFVERIYDEGRVRSEKVRIRFLDDPMEVEDAVS